VLTDINSITNWKGNYSLIDEDGTTVGQNTVTYAPGTTPDASIREYPEGYYTAFRNMVTYAGNEGYNYIAWHNDLTDEGYYFAMCNSKLIRPQWFVQTASVAGLYCMHDYTYYRFNEETGLFEQQTLGTFMGRLKPGSGTHYTQPIPIRLWNQALTYTTSRFVILASDTDVMDDVGGIYFRNTRVIDSLIGIEDVDDLPGMAKALLTFVLRMVNTLFGLVYILFWLVAVVGQYMYVALGASTVLFSFLPTEIWILTLGYIGISLAYKIWGR
jgi:hypothetical protein